MPTTPTKLKRLTNEVFSACKAIQDGGAPAAVVVDSLGVFIEEGQFKKQDFEAALNKIATTPQSFKPWFELFKVNRLNVLTEAVTTLQDPVTTLQPDIETKPDPRPRSQPRPRPASAIVPAKVQAKAPVPQMNSKAACTDSSEVYQGYYDPSAGLREVAYTCLSQLIVGDRETGRTTFLQALLSLLFSKSPSLAIKIISTKANTWLGLEKHPNVVTYAVGDALDMLPSAARIVQEVYSAMMRRIQRNQDALRSGSNIPVWEPYLLVVDSWSVINENLSSLYKDEKRRSKCLNTLSQLRAVIQQGSSVNVQVILVAESHSSKGTGLPITVLRSMAITGLCLVTPQQRGGVAAFQDLISDRSLLSQGARDDLRALFTKAIKNGHGLVAPLRGTPRVFNNEDYGPLLAGKGVEYAGIFSEMN